MKKKRKKTSYLYKVAYQLMDQSGTFLFIQGKQPSLQQDKIGPLDLEGLGCQKLFCRDCHWGDRRAKEEIFSLDCVLGNSTWTKKIVIFIDGEFQ